MAKNDQHNSAEESGRPTNTLSYLWGAIYGLWMFWLLASWVCAAIFVVGGMWGELATWLWLASALGATAFRFVLPTRRKK